MLPPAGAKRGRPRLQPFCEPRPSAKIARVPLKFEIYRDGQRLTDFTPAAAMAMGPESVPIAGEVVFKDGLLAVNRTDDHAVGVSLLWDVGPLGCFQMETT